MSKPRPQWIAPAQPSAGVPSPTHWQAAAERYLAAQGSVLWGRAYDIHSEAGRVKAAAFLAAAVAGVLEQR